MVITFNVAYKCHLKFKMIHSSNNIFRAALYSVPLCTVTFCALLFMRHPFLINLISGHKQLTDGVDVCFSLFISWFLMTLYQLHGLYSVKWHGN
jgi:hypothetical protein